MFHGGLMDTEKQDRNRVRPHLLHYHKIKGRGTGLRWFPHRDLYERYGLYKVSTGAGWRSAHASA